MILPSYLKYTNYSNEILKKNLKGMDCFCCVLSHEVWISLKLGKAQK